MEENIRLIDDGSFWLPGSYSTLSSDVDLLFNAIYWMSFVLTVGIVGTLLFFTFKYIRSKSNPIAKKQVKHNTKLEVIWTTIPFIIVMIIFYWGFVDYLKLTVSPEDAMEIRATGKKWLWAFEYPQDGITTVNELYVPVNTPVKLIMSSEDVIHSFFIPNFRVKKDVVPNRYTNIWFEATKEGRYQVFCTEYCGDGHSDMLADLVVLSQADYDEWKQNANFGDDVPLNVLGEKVFTSKGCNACHSIDGSVQIGPTWKDLYGAERKLTTGETVIADDNYLRESVVYAGNKVVEGYQDVMPSYSGLLSDREIDGLIEYIKSLKAE